MKGQLFQLINVDSEPIALFHTDDDSVTDEIIGDAWRDYDDSDTYQDAGIEGFEEFFRQKTGYIIQRVFVENIYL